MTTLTHDKLPMREKAPLALALLAQSYVVFLWYLRSTHGIHPYIDFAIALAAGLALDWLTVSTVMGRREGRTSLWSWLTSVGAFVGSAMIAYDTYAAHWWPLDGKALLHICFPSVVLLYSLHLASPRQQEQAAPEQLTNDAPLLALARVAEQPEYPAPVAVVDDALHTVTASIDATLHVCPKCGIRLDAARWRAARRWGHCAKCKE